MHSEYIQKLGNSFGELFYSGSIDSELLHDTESLSIDDAYKVQNIAVNYRKAKGEHVSGYKVGCTSSSIRKQLNLTEPYNAVMMGEHIHIENGKALPLSQFVNCAIEPELVICLGKDIDTMITDKHELIRYIEYLSPGIEVHNFKFWYGKPTAYELIMSNGLFACLVVGDQKVKPERFDFINAAFTVYRNQTEVGSGIASDIMGGPLDSLQWLANDLAKRGDYIKAGQMVIPGSPVELIRINEPNEYTIEIAEVGKANAKFI